MSAVTRSECRTSARVRISLLGTFVAALSGCAAAAPHPRPLDVAAMTPGTTRASVTAGEPLVTIERARVLLDGAEVATVADVEFPAANGPFIPSLVARLVATRAAVATVTAPSGRVRVAASADASDVLAEAALSSARLAGFEELTITSTGLAVSTKFQLPEPTFFLEPAEGVTLPEKGPRRGGLMIVQLTRASTRVQFHGPDCGALPVSFESTDDPSARIRLDCFASTKPCVSSLQVDFGEGSRLVDALRLVNRVRPPRSVALRFARRTFFPEGRTACRAGSFAP